MSLLSAADQTKQIIWCAGGMDQRSRQLKGIYATLQALFPKLFPIPADGLFFGWWNSEITAATDWLMDVTHELRQIIWFGSQDGIPKPVHRTNLLLADAKTPGCSELDEAVKATALGISLLPPELVQCWMYLLGQHTEQLILAGGMESPRFVPTIHDAELRKHQAELSRQLSSIGYGPLSYAIEFDSESAHQSVFLLPGSLTGEAKDAFVKYYQDYVQHLVVEPKYDSTGLQLGIRFDGGTNWERWLTCYLREAEGAVDPDSCTMYVGLQDYHALVACHIRELEDDLQVMTNTEDGEMIRRIIEEHRKVLTTMQPSVASRAFKVAQACAKTVRDYKQIVQWRFTDIVELVTNLRAAVNACDEPLQLKLVNASAALPCNGGGDWRIKQVTDVVIEYADEFVVGAPRFLGSNNPFLQPGIGMHISSLLLHPASVCRALLSAPSGRSLKGGAVIVP